MGQAGNIATVFLMAQSVTYSPSSDPFPGTESSSIASKRANFDNEISQAVAADHFVTERRPNLITTISRYTVLSASKTLSDETTIRTVRGFITGALKGVWDDIRDVSAMAMGKSQRLGYYLQGYRRRVPEYR